MGWSYRKSIRLGPVRVNLSRSGVGYSVGVRGFRTGVRPNGRTYRTLSVPGTGLSYTKSGGSSRAAPGCLVLLALPIALFAGYLLT